MSETDEYRQFANDCIVWARIATSDDMREQFLELAKMWMSDAVSIDQGIELRRAKASEMAGEEIDRLGRRGYGLDLKSCTGARND
jgi:hypothetical protein